MPPAARALPRSALALALALAPVAALEAQDPTPTPDGGPTPAPRLYRPGPTFEAMRQTPLGAMPGFLPGAFGLDADAPQLGAMLMESNRTAYGMTLPMGVGQLALAFSGARPGSRYTASTARPAIGAGYGAALQRWGTRATSLSVGAMLGAGYEWRRERVYSDQYAQTWHGASHAGAALYLPVTLALHPFAKPDARSPLALRLWAAPGVSLARMSAHDENSFDPLSGAYLSTTSVGARWAAAPFAMAGIRLDDVGPLRVELTVRMEREPWYGTQPQGTLGASLRLPRW